MNSELTNHSTRWHHAIALLKATAQVVASVLDKHVFGYMGSLEQSHTDYGLRFESHLMTELS